MTRKRALQVFDLVKEAGLPITIQAYHQPQYSPGESWSVSMGNLNHVDLLSLMQMLEKEDFNARTSTTSGFVIEEADEQHRRKIIG